MKLFFPTLRDSAPARQPITAAGDAPSNGQFSIHRLNVCPACQGAMVKVRAAGHPAWLCEVDRVVLPRAEDSDV